MLVLRIVFVVFVLVIGGLVGAWVASSDRRYLSYAWRATKIGLVVLAVFLVLFALGRVVPL
jgi:hypothetical protein